MAKSTGKRPLFCKINLTKQCGYEIISTLKGENKMMKGIEKFDGFKTYDGDFFPTLKEAEAHQRFLNFIKFLGKECGGYIEIINEDNLKEDYYKLADFFGVDANNDFKKL